MWIGEFNFCKIIFYNGGCVLSLFKTYNRQMDEELYEISTYFIKKELISIVDYLGLTSLCVSCVLHVDLF